MSADDVCQVPLSNNESISCHVLFAKYFLLLFLHIQTVSSYTINERIGPDLRPEVCHWVILCYIKQNIYIDDFPWLADI